MKRLAKSKDGLWVEMTMESKSRKSVGLDFVSGGSYDYQAKSEQGYRVTVKGHHSVKPDILIDVTRTGLKDITGEDPTVWPPTHISGLITAEIDKIPEGLSQKEILEGLAQYFERTKIKKSASSKVKEVFTKPKPTTLKVLVIPEDLHNALEKARLEAQDLEMKEYDIDQFLQALLKHYKETKKA